MNPTPERSMLRIRDRPHIDPTRADEVVIEVLRNGEVVATIFGTREGVQIVSEFASNNGPFFFEAIANTPSFVFPLLRPGEECPWCHGSDKFFLDPEVPCPVCFGRLQQQLKETK